MDKLPPNNTPDNSDPLPGRVLKLIGGDTELGNFVYGGAISSDGTGYEASRAVLHEVDGLPRTGFSCVAPTATADSYSHRTGVNYASNQNDTSWGSYSQDWGRQYLSSNGGCIYIDMNHLELCSPEVRSAHDYVVAWHAMLGITRTALGTANARMPGNKRIVLLANNSDGEGQSYGSHLSFLISRQTWDELFYKRMYPSVFFLMAYQVSSIVFTGQGKVGSENGRPSVEYQIAQRADFFETLVGERTTYQRPLINSRDEPLCGYANKVMWNKPNTGSMARLHVIFYDSTLCHHATFLKVGVMQIILAMIEAGCVHPGLLLRDPLDAVLHWSHDPDLRVRAELLSGQQLTAVELQLLFLEQAKIFVDSGECECYVPEARKIITLWEDTLIKLKNRNFAALIPRLDWVLKRFLIKRSLEQSASLDWSSPQAKHMDLIYSSLDLHEGLYWTLQQEGVVERLVSVQEIENRTSMLILCPPGPPKFAGDGKPCLTC